MIRKNCVVQCRTYSTKDLLISQQSRGSLPALHNNANNVEDSRKVTWRDMPASNVVLKSIEDTNFKKSQPIVQTVDDKVNNLNLEE